MTCSPQLSGDEALRRFFDIALAASALILLSPLLALISAAILAESGRPIIFVQPRLGQNGNPFSMFKFRKFSKTYDGAGLPLTLRNDARLSRVGRLLAASKLDELPQLANVLRGEMSIVGPRPESVELAGCFTAATSSVLLHRPGIFGPTQVIFRNECNMYPNDADPLDFYRTVLFPMKVQLDLDYYERRTLISDLQWIVLGIFVTLGVRVAIKKVKNDAHLLPFQG